MEEMALDHEGQTKFKCGDMAEYIGGKENDTNGMNLRWWMRKSIALVWPNTGMQQEVMGKVAEVFEYQAKEDRLCPAEYGVLMKENYA